MRNEGTYSSKVLDIIETVVIESWPETFSQEVDRGDAHHLSQEMACQLYERGYNIVRMPDKSKAIVKRFSKKKSEGGE